MDDFDKKGPGLFSVHESWKMSEVDQVVALIRDVGCWRLGNRNGCVCSSFSIRNVNVNIYCGKGQEQGVLISSRSADYYHKEETFLWPVMDEVLRQLREDSGRSDNWAQHFGSYDEKEEA